MNIEPLITLPAFIFGAVIIMIAARLTVEVYFIKQNKSLRDVAPSNRQKVASVSQQTIYRYYNRKSKRA